LEKKIMSTSRLVHHAHLVWRTERVIAELRLKRLLGNLGLQALAALMTGFSLLLIELAAYFALVQAWSAIASAAVLSLCNLVIAALLIPLAQHRSASLELALANEVHQEALAAFAAEIQQVEAEAPASLRAAIESTAIPLLLPLIPLVIQRLRRHRTENAAAETH
jgi:hypothetical protein